MYVDLNAYSFYTRHHRQESPQATTGHTSSYQEVFNLLNNSGQKGRYRFVFCFPALCRDVVLRSIAPWVASYYSYGMNRGGDPLDS